MLRYIIYLYNNVETWRDKSNKIKILWCRKTNIWNVNVDNVVILTWIETKTDCKYLIGYLDKVIRPLILILPEMSEYL